MVQLKKQLHLHSGEIMLYVSQAVPFLWVIAITIQLNSWEALPVRGSVDKPAMAPAQCSFLSPPVLAFKSCSKTSATKLHDSERCDGVAMQNHRNMDFPRSSVPLLCAVLDDSASLGAKKEGPRPPL